MAPAHRLTLVVALVGAVVAYLASDRTEETVSYERIALDESLVRGELTQIERESAFAGYAVVERRALTLESEVVTVPVEPRGGCVLVVAGVWGALSLEHLTVRGAEGESSVAAAAPEWGWRERLAPHVALCEAAGGTARAGSAVEVRLQVARLFDLLPSGGGELVVMRGPEPAPYFGRPRLATVMAEVVEEQTLIARPLVHAAVTFFLVGLLGLMVEVGVSRADVSPDGHASLRRLSVALPSVHRATVGPLVDEVARGRLEALVPLRAHLLDCIDDVRAAWWSEERAASSRIALRVSKLADDLGRRTRSAPSDYRHRGGGTLVLTWVLRHECELPDFPSVVRRSYLPELLRGLLPAKLGELQDARVMLHPKDPSQAYDDAAQAAVFPELANLDLG